MHDAVLHIRSLLTSTLTQVVVFLCSFSFYYYWCLCESSLVSILSLAVSVNDIYVLYTILFLFFICFVVIVRFSAIFVAASLCLAGRGCNLSAKKAIDGTRLNKFNIL